MIKSPKEKFQQSQIRTGQWAQIVANPVFDEAIDAALLQLQRALPESPDLSAFSYMKLVGAENFIQILKTIHEKSEQTKEPTRQGLNYQAGV